VQVVDDARDVTMPRPDVVVAPTARCLGREEAAPR
jgi:hypothetical protein